MKTKGLILSVLLAAEACGLAATNDLATILQKGLFEEEANHNLSAAIPLYQAVVTQFDKDRRLAATAVFRLGECYRKQGITNEAAAQYQRILAEFPDQTQLTNLSSQSLLALGRSPSIPGAPSISEAARRQQLQLFEAEIALVEQKLAATQKRFESGVASQEEIWATQRELLGLKRQVAAVEAGWPPVFVGTNASLRAAPGEEGPAMAATPATSAEAEEVRRIQAMIQDSPDLINAAADESRSTPLIKAAMNGQLVVAKFLVNSGANLESKDSNGRTALYWAASQGHRALVELLLATKADPNNGDKDGKTALHGAAEKGFRSVGEVLLDHGASVNAKTSVDTTPLHLAVANGFRAMTELLLSRQANVDANAALIQTPGFQFSGTALHVAATRGDQPLAELLLTRKARLESVSRNGVTALGAAASAGHRQIAAMLLAQGAQVNAKNANERERGWTPLHYAVVARRKEVVELLLQHKADPNARIETGYNANTYGRPPSGPPATGYTALLLATTKCDAEISQLLLSAGADPSVRSESGDTPVVNTMTLCNQPERGRILALLLDRGAATESTDPRGNTPLLLAATKRDRESLELLLKHQANPNARDENGYTALHYLAFLMDSRGPLQDVLPMAQALVDAKADVNARVSASDDRTPLKQLVQLLSRPGNTASSDTFREFADLLRKAGAVEDLPQLDRIELARPSANYRTVVFWRGTNDFNKFSLFEALSIHYNLCRAPGYGPDLVSLSGTPNIPARLPGVPSGPGLVFPDFARAVIRRATPDGRGRKSLPVQLAGVFEEGKCSGDMPLQWGDIIEIPEADHPINASWPGLPEKVRAVLVACLTRTVEVQVKGQSTNMVLRPEPAPFGPKAFTLSETLLGSGLLRASSDLSRVRVTRQDPAIGQSYRLSLDCSRAGGGSDLWLRDHDVIEVPDKP